ncbi:hypothetical protein D3C73_1112650 [compost metagenome]
MGIHGALGSLLTQRALDSIQLLPDLGDLRPHRRHLGFGGRLGQGAVDTVDLLLNGGDALELGPDLRPGHTGIHNGFNRIEMLADSRDLGGKFGAYCVDRLHGDLASLRVQLEHRIPKVGKVKVVAVNTLAQLLCHQGHIDVVLA